MKSFYFRWLCLTAVAFLATVVAATCVSAQTGGPLFEAIRSGSLDRVRGMVERGADVNLYGAAALYQAASSGHLEIAKFLVQAGAKVNSAMFESGFATPLRIAAKHEHYPVVNYLLSAGADPAVGGTQRSSPLTAAVMTGNLDQVKKVVQGGKADLEFREMNMRKGDGLTALMIAAKRGFGPIADYLLARGAKVDTARKCGETALYYAAQSGSVPLAKLLLDKGAEVHLTAPAGCNSPAPIRIARDIDVVRLLLAAGANPNVHPNSPDNWARPINKAVSACRGELVELLVRHGAKFEDVLKQEFEKSCG